MNNFSNNEHPRRHSREGGNLIMPTHIAFLHEMFKEQVKFPKWELEGF
jgi:hypothetical protein